MFEPIRRVAVSATYQLTVALGLVLFPLALAMRHTVGVGLPVNRLLNRVQTAYESEPSEVR